TPEGRLQWIAKSLEASCQTYPQTASRDFSLLYCGRKGEGMSCSFYGFALKFTAGTLSAWAPIAIPTSSGPLAYSDGEEHFAYGSGRSAFKDAWKRWTRSEVGGTIAAVPV